MFEPKSPKLSASLNKVFGRLEVSDFKQPANTDLSTAFLCMTPRSGSSYFGSLLRINRMGKFAELFRYAPDVLTKRIEEAGSSKYEDYIQSIINQHSMHGRFGAKVGWLHLAHIYYSGAYDHLFRDSKFIYITREDVVAQAVSLFVASNTGYYHSVQTGMAKHKEKIVDFNFDKIWRHVTEILEMQSAWDRFFATEGVLPMRISYEKLTQDPASAVTDAAQLLGVELPNGPILESDYDVVRTKQHEVLAQRTYEEAQRRRRESALEFLKR